jgi:membrane-bound lytic murein transglycosylase D
MLAATPVDSVYRAMPDTVTSLVPDSMHIPVDSLDVDSLQMSAFDKVIEESYVRWRYDLVQSDSCATVQWTDTMKKEDYVRYLSQMPTLIEMPYNQVVRSYIDSYVKRYPKRLSSLLALSKYYFPIFENALEAGNLPLELKYLPVIESALNPSAKSYVGAAGLWQFMPATGRLYGLEVNSLIDERCDPYKSSKAAVAYLKDLYEIYGDWMLVIAAYNCGPGNVNKAIRRSGGKRDYWDIYEYLPRETRGYVPAFIAANYAMYYAEDLYHICPSELKLPLATDTICINYRVHLEQISDCLGVHIDELRRLNPQYRYDLVPGNSRTCVLCLPDDYAYRYLTNKDSIVAYKSELISRKVENKIAMQTTYKVRSGDNLWTIAKKKGVSVAAIRKANAPKNLNVLQIGQVIKLPVR